MSKKITWVTLQKTIKETFKNSKMKSFKDVLEKDRNGWNWILTFDMLENETSLLLHTKFIFKLDKNKKYLRLNDFLYLYDLNCKYRYQKFSDEVLETITDGEKVTILSNVKELINDILINNRFGENLMAASEFMISPSKSINKHFYENDITNLSVFEVDYEPHAEVTPCKSFSLDFQFNVNNKYDVHLDIKKDGKDDFQCIFTYNEKTETVEIEDLTTFTKTIAAYVKRQFASE